jgi:hypothetical protein
LCLQQLARRAQFLAMCVAQTIQDLVLASKRHSRVRSRAESERQTSEKKTEETQNALDKAKAEIQRLKVQWGFDTATAVEFWLRICVGAVQ